MLTLTYGLKKPETGDKGSVFFPALEDNIDQLDAHTHNGTDSSLLPSSSMSWTTQTILAASWSAIGEPGNYRQLVTMPSGLTFNTRQVFFRDSTSGHYYNLTVEKASANTYYVYINDNTISLTAVYV